MPIEPNPDAQQPDAPNPDEPAAPRRNLRDVRYPKKGPSRRQETSMPADLEDSAEDSAGADDRRLAVGVRLTTAQRRTVVRLMLEYDDVATVSEILAEEYPEIPLVSDRTLRIYKNTDRARDLDLREEIAAKRTTTGMATRQGRISHLMLHYQRLQALLINEDRTARREKRTPSPQLEIVRELRLLIAEIAQESGDRPGVVRGSPGATPPAKPPGSERGEVYGVEDPERAAYLAAKLDRLLEERQRMREAERLSLPPPIDVDSL